MVAAWGEYPEPQPLYYLLENRNKWATKEK
jgi:hypothetical protein